MTIISSFGAISLGVFTTIVMSGVRVTQTSVLHLTLYFTPDECAEVSGFMKAFVYMIHTHDLDMNNTYFGKCANAYNCKIYLVFKASDIL